MRFIPTRRHISTGTHAIVHDWHACPCSRPRNPRFPIYRLCVKTAFRARMRIFKSWIWCLPCSRRRHESDNANGVRRLARTRLVVGLHTKNPTCESHQAVSLGSQALWRAKKSHFQPSDEMRMKKSIRFCNNNKRHYFVI